MKRLVTISLFTLFYIFSSGQVTEPWLNQGGTIGSNPDITVYRKSHTIIAPGMSNLMSSPWRDDAWLSVFKPFGGYDDIQLLSSDNTPGTQTGSLVSGDDDYISTQIRFVGHDASTTYPWAGNIEFNVKGTSNAFSSNSALKIFAGNQVGINTGSNTQLAATFLVNGTMKVTGTSTFDDNVKVLGALQVGNSGTFDTDVTIGGPLQVNNTADITNNVTVGGTLQVNQNSTFDDKVTIGSTEFPVINNGEGDPLRLFVAGGILAQEVVVKLSEGNWPDYVFDEGRDLLPLSEVKDYITENKRLPNFKSAAEIEENGLELKETVVLQQEKIEELYLYIIELEKRLDSMEENQD